MDLDISDNQIGDREATQFFEVLKRNFNLKEVKGINFKTVADFKKLYEQFQELENFALKENLCLLGTKIDGSKLPMPMKDYKAQYEAKATFELRIWASRNKTDDQKALNTVLTLLKAKDKKLTDKPNKDFFSKIIEKLNSLPDIEFPTNEELGKHNPLTESLLIESEIAAAYMHGLVRGGYGGKNLQGLKEKVKNFRELKSIKDIDLSVTYKSIFNLFLLSKNKLTLENFIKFCTELTQDVIDDKIKLYILTLLVDLNYKEGEVELALSQAEEALKLAETLDESQLSDLYRNCIKQVRDDYLNILLKYCDGYSENIEKLRSCLKSGDTDQANEAKKWVEDNYKAKLGTPHDEIAGISKAVLHLSMELKEYEEAIKVLDSLNPENVKNLASISRPNIVVIMTKFVNYPDVYCKLYYYLAVNWGYDAKKAIAKIKVVNPYSLILKELEYYIKEISSDNTEPPFPEHQENSLVEDKPELPSIKKLQPEFLSKEEVLELSEDDFLKACEAGRVKPGLKKAYYKQFLQVDAEDQLNSSIDKNYSKPQEFLPSYSWYIENLLYDTSDSIVFKINDNSWGVVAWDELDLDYLQRKQVKNAITNYGKKNGVIIYDNLAKILTDAGLRVYATQKYENEKGKYLVVFNKQGSHSKIKNVEDPRGKMDIIKVSSTPPDAEIPYKNNGVEVKTNSDSEDNANVGFHGVGPYSITIEGESITCTLTGKCPLHNCDHGDDYS